MITYFRCSVFVISRAFPPPMPFCPHSKHFPGLNSWTLLLPAAAAGGCRWLGPFWYGALLGLFFFFSALDMALLIRFPSSESSARGLSTYSDTTLHPDSVESASFISFCPPWGRRGFKSRIHPPYPQHVVKGRRYIAVVADTALNNNLTYKFLPLFD